MIEHYPGVSPVLALTRMIEREEGHAAALAFLSRQLQQSLLVHRSIVHRARSPWPA